MSMLFKRFKDWATSITAFRTGDVIPVDGPDGTAKMLATDLLRETAENALAGNIAPAFDPTRTSGNPYNPGELVAYNGKTYIFKNSHYGAWDAGDVIPVFIGLKNFLFRRQFLRVPLVVFVRGVLTPIVIILRGRLVFRFQMVLTSTFIAILTTKPMHLLSLLICMK